MAKTKCILAITAAILLSCKDESREPGDAKAPERQFSEINKAKWLIGEWKNSTPEGIMTEIWTKENDSLFNGKAFFIAGKDTVFAEAIQLAEHNGKLTYIPTVKGQNKGEPVAFEQVSSSGRLLAFENAAHDFPQKITYTLIKSDSLVAEISGMEKGKERKETFPMKKINN